MILAGVVLDVHGWFSWVVVLANGAAGLWAGTAHWLPRLRTRYLWWFTGGAQASIFVQAGLGTWLMARDDLEPPEFHAFYGFSSLVAVGVIYSYRPQLRGNVLLLYGGGGLFLMGMAIRAMVI